MTKYLKDCLLIGYLSKDFCMSLCIHTYLVSFLFDIVIPTSFFLILLLVELLFWLRTPTMNHSLFVQWQDY